MTIRRSLSALVCLALLAGFAHGQFGFDPTTSETLIQSTGSLYGFRDDANPDLWVGVYLNGVEVQHGDLRLRGERLVAVIEIPEQGDQTLASDQAGMLVPYRWVRELYLEGDVALEQGPERVVGAQAVYVNNLDGTVVVFQGETRVEFAEGPIVVRFDQMRRVADGSATLEGVTYSNCDFQHQHWYIEAEHATITPTPSGRILDTGPNTAVVGDIPVLWWPGMNINIDKDRLPLRRAEFGTSSRYGTEIRTWWGFGLNKPANSIAKSLGYDGHIDLDLEWQTSSLSRRGWFNEPVFRYETDHSKGMLLGSYINDSASTDALDVPVTDHTRGRIKLQHRTKIDDAQTLDVEFSYLSDPGYLREYYDSEFRTGKEQESYINYTNVVDNKAVQFLFRTRVNNFQTQVEYQPRIEYMVVGEKLDSFPFGDAFYSARSFADNAEIKYSDLDPPTGPDNFRNTRAGTAVGVDWPIDIDGDRVVVNSGSSVAYFEKGANGHHQTRVAMESGATWTRTYSGVDSEAHSDTWNIDGLRRIIEPMIGYQNVHTISVRPNDLVPIDNEEKLDRYQRFIVGFRDRIQTHQNGEVATILDTEVRLPLFPNDKRDNQDQFTNEPETIGLLEWDTRYKPGANIRFLKHAKAHWRGKYDPNDNGYTESYFSVSTQLDPDRTIMISNNKARGVSNFATLGTQWVLTDKWMAALFLQRDLRAHEKNAQGFILRQRAHRWFIDLEFDYQRGESVTSSSSDNEVRVSVRFTPAIMKRDQTLLDEIGSRAY